MFRQTKKRIWAGRRVMFERMGPGAPKRKIKRLDLTVNRWVQEKPKQAEEVEY